MLSSRTLRPLGPRVTLTALARISTPRSRRTRASEANLMSLAAMTRSPCEEHRSHAHGPLGARWGVNASQTRTRLQKNVGSGVIRAALLPVHRTAFVHSRSDHTETQWRQKRASSFNLTCGAAAQR